MIWRPLVCALLVSLFMAAWVSLWLKLFHYVWAAGLQWVAAYAVVGFIGLVGCIVAAQGLAALGVEVPDA